MDKHLANSSAVCPLKFARAMLFANALVWLSFALLGVFRAAETRDSLRWFYSGLMVANAIVMFWLGMRVTAGAARNISLAILFMALNVVLSITDQFGWIDLGILLLNSIILVLLLISRQRLKGANAK